MLGTGKYRQLKTGECIMSGNSKKFGVGFTIIELLLALAMTALLLTAVAIAFNASMTNYKENEDIFRTVNNARQALMRMASQIRSGLVDPADIANQSFCKLKLPDPNNPTLYLGEVTYRYDSNDVYPHRGKLYLNKNGTDYLLCDNVTAASFTKTPTSNGLDVKSVQISITVGQGSAEQTFSAAAVVRKVLEQ